MEPLTFQEIILNLQTYWSDQGCAILQPYDMEVGAGTFHPATVLRPLGPKPWNVAYVQPSRRPTDGRYGNHPNRLQHYYQFQVIMKPSPDNLQQLYLGSLKAIGIDQTKHDIRFVEDDWESPTLGASGLGWEVWLNGMEVSQYTYMQQIGGIDVRPVPGELTYGLERLAMYVQGVNRYHDLKWNKSDIAENNLTYEDIDNASEIQFCDYNFKYANTDNLFDQFNHAEEQSKTLIEKNLPFPAYDFCIKASHIFNILNARGVISVTERANYISRVRALAKASCEKWLEIQEK